MKTVAEYTDLAVPDYSLSYFVNGDASGLEDSDKANCDAWFAQFETEAKACGGSVIFSPSDDEGGFVHNPEFGLACNCVDCTVLIVK